MFSGLLRQKEDSGLSGEIRFSSSKSGLGGARPILPYCCIAGDDFFGRQADGAHNMAI